MISMWHGRRGRVVARHISSIIAFGFVGIACSSGLREPRCVVALFDASSTAIGEGMPKYYRDDFGRILKYAGSRDVILANVIREDPVHTTGPQQWPINIHVKSLDEYTDYGLVNELKAITTSVQTPLAELGMVHSGASSIIDALGVASEPLHDRECRDVRDRRIVVFSDMLENSRRWEIKDDLSVRMKDSDAITTTLALPPEETPLDAENVVDALLDFETRRQPHVDLVGIQVYLIGALGTDVVSGPHKNPQPPGNRPTMLRLFWKKYLERTGAMLVEDRWWRLRLPDWP